MNLTYGTFLLVSLTQKTPFMGGFGGQEANVAVAAMSAACRGLTAPCCRSRGPQTTRSSVAPGRRDRAAPLAVAAANEAASRSVRCRSSKENQLPPEGYCPDPWARWAVPVVPRGAAAPLCAPWAGGISVCAAGGGRWRAAAPLLAFGESWQLLCLAGGEDNNGNNFS